MRFLLAAFGIVGILAATGTVSAQPPVNENQAPTAAPPNGAGPAQQASPFDAVGELEKLRRRVEFLEMQLNDKDKGVISLLGKHSTQLTTLTGTVGNHESRLRDLEALHSAVRSNTEILNQIAKQSNSQPGRYYLNILGNMQGNGEFQRDVQQSVQGRILIQNYPDRERILYINGSPWRALPNRSFVMVPYGRVSASQSPFAPQPSSQDWRWVATPQYTGWQMEYDFSRPWQ
jgi:hypothetical protein